MPDVSHICYTRPLHIRNRIHENLSHVPARPRPGRRGATVRIKAILSATTFASVALAAAAAPAHAAVGPVTPSFAVDHATSAVRSHATAFAAGAGDTFASRGVLVETNGASHVHLNRSYLGLPV